MKHNLKGNISHLETNLILSLLVVPLHRVGRRHCRGVDIGVLRDDQSETQKVRQIQNC